MQLRALTAAKLENNAQRKHSSISRSYIFFAHFNTQSQHVSSALIYRLVPNEISHSFSDEVRIMCSIHLGSVKAYFLEGFSTFINTKIRMDALGHESRTVPTDFSSESQWQSFFTPQRLPNLPKQQHQVNVPVSRAPNALALPRWECELSWSEPNSSPRNTTQDFTCMVGAKVYEVYPS